MPVGHAGGKKYAHCAVERGPRRLHDEVMHQLARIRKAKKLTQTQLAEAVGCHQATISKLEKGDKNVTLDLIERIARVLGVEPWQLLGVGELRQRYLEAMDRATPAKRQAVLLLLSGENEPH